MESVSDALKRLADGASAEGFPTDAHELRKVEKRVSALQNKAKPIRCTSSYRGSEYDKRGVEFWGG